MRIYCIKKIFSLCIMENEDFKLFTFEGCDLKIFREGKIQFLDKRSKNPEWKDKKLRNCSGYLITDINNQTFYAHYLVALCYLGERPPHKEIDHINSIRSDNRVGNLQYISPSENCLKRTTWNGRPIKGYTKRKNGKYTVRLCINKKQTNLGTYDNEEKAIEIYIQAKAKLLIHIEVE